MTPIKSNSDDEMEYQGQGSLNDVAFALLTEGMPPVSIEADWPDVPEA